MNRKLIQISAFLLAFGFPVNTRLANIMAILFCTICLIYSVKEKRLKNFDFQILKFSSLIIVTVFLFGLFVNPDFQVGINHFLRRISFLFFPVFLFLLNREELKSVFKSASFGLISGCVVSGTFLLIKIFIVYFEPQESFRLGFDLFNYYHTYHNFTAPLDFHPTYYGSYFFLAVIILSDLIFKSSKNKTKFFCFLVLLFLLLICLFINSRIILFLVFCVLVFYIFLFLQRTYRLNKKLFWGMLATIMILTAVAIGLIKNTYIYYRFTNELKWESSSQINSKFNEENGGDSRLARWNSIKEVIAQEPLFGHGIGNEKSILENQFQKDGLEFSADNRYDSHNLYLSYGVQFGIVGVVLLMFYYLSNLIVSVRKRKPVFFFLIFGLIFISLFENYLNNNAGIVFTAFFQNLLLFESIKKE